MRRLETKVLSIAITIVLAPFVVAEPPFMFASRAQPGERAIAARALSSNSKNSVKPVKAGLAGTGNYKAKAAGRLSTSNTTALISVDSSWSFTNVGDSYVDRSFPNANFATATTMKSGTLARGKFRSFLKFDLSPLIGYSINSADLALYVGDSKGKSDVSVSLPKDDWAAGGITWNNQPVAEYIGATTVKHGQWAHINVEKAVQETLYGARPNYGLMIDSEGYKELVSKENSDTSKRPCLTVTYSLPGAFDLVSPSEGAYVGSSPTFSWSASENVDHYQLWKDGALDKDGIPKTQTTTTSSTAFSEGLHTWFVRAVNNLGSFTQSASTRTIVVDTTAPASMLTADPVSADGRNGWYVTSPSIVLSSSEPGTTYYQWDSTSTGGWAAYAVPITAPEGEHALYYYSKDIAGNIEAVQKRILEVDGVAPSSSIATPTDGARLTGADCAITGTSSDADAGLARVEVSTDGGATWVAASGADAWGYDWVCPADGPHAIKSRAIDRAGNVETPLAGVSVTVDLPPTTTISTTPFGPDGSNGWFKTAPMITLSSSQLGTTYYQWDSTETSGWIASVGDFGAPAGAHTIYYYSVDLQGNSEAVRSFSVKTDGAQPAAFDLDAPLDGSWSNNTLPSFSWHESSDVISGLAGYRLYVDGNLAIDNIAPSVASTSFTSDLSEGAHTWCVEAFDTAGNAYRSAQRTVGIDTTPPTIFDPNSPADGASVNSGRPLFSWMASSDAGSGLSGYQLFIDDVLAADDIAPAETSVGPYTDLSLGEHSWYVKARDNAGNVRQSATRSVVVVDTTYPAASEMAPTGVVNSHTPTISARLGDSWTGVDGTSVVMKLDGNSVFSVYQPTTSYVSYVPVENLAPGEHSVEITFSDYAGNQSVMTWRFSVFGTVVGGAISQDTTWTPAGGPYIFQSNVTVDPGVVLTIEPGAVLKLWNSALIVNGRLIANGTDQDRIYVTSLRDDSIGGDTNGDGSATAPAPGDWSYLKCANGSSGDIAHMVVRFGGNGVWVDSASPSIGYSSIADCLSTGICLSGSSAPRITDSTIESNNTLANNFGAGIDIGGTAHPTITGCLIRNNGAPNDPDGHGIYSSSTGSLTIAGNTISGNQSDAIYQSGTGSVAITNNIITGNADHAVRLNVNASILDASGNAVSGNKYNGVRLNGTLAINRVLEPINNMPYILVGGSAVSVISGVSLTLKPGVVVKLEGGGSQNLVVNGSLNVAGTSSDRVEFTSIKDDSVGGDTNGDGTATSPAKNDWGYIKLASGSSGSVNYATLHYGYYGVFADTASTTISHSAISDCFQAGVCLSGGNASVVGNAISSSQYGVYVLGPANPKVNGNDFSNNTTYDIYNASYFKIDATNNYWGKHPYQVGELYLASAPSAYNYTVDQNGIITSIAVVSAPWSTTPFWSGMMVP